MLAQAERDVVEDRQAVEQGGHLEQEPEPQPHLDQFLAVELGHVAAVEPDAPLVGRNRPINSLSITVLPQPLSPMMHTVSPRWIVRSMSRKTCW